MSTDSEFLDLKVQVANLTTSVNKVQNDTAELVEYFRAAQGFIKILELIGKIGKPLLWSAAIIGTVSAGWNWKSILPFLK